MISVGDRHCFDAVPDPNIHVNVDTDPDRHQNDADPLADPTPSFFISRSGTQNYKESCYASFECNLIYCYGSVPLDYGSGSCSSVVYKMPTKILCFFCFFAFNFFGTVPYIYIGL